MTQDERWEVRYNEVVTFIETNKRNPSKYDAEERGEYYTWLKHNRRQMNAGTMKPERAEKFRESNLINAYVAFYYFLKDNIVTVQRIYGILEKEVA